MVLKQLPTFRIILLTQKTLPTFRITFFTLITLPTIRGRIVKIILTKLLILLQIIILFCVKHFKRLHWLMQGKIAKFSKKKLIFFSNSLLS